MLSDEQIIDVHCRHSSGRSTIYEVEMEIYRAIAKAAQREALEEAAKLYCGGCADNEDAAFDGNWYHPIPNAEGEECDAQEIRAMIEEGEDG